MLMAVVEIYDFSIYYVRGVVYILIYFLFVIFYMCDVFFVRVFRMRLDITFRHEAGARSIGKARVT